MRLKRREDVEWLELPKVESPYFARAWAESQIPVSGHELYWVQGLGDVILDDLSHNQLIWDSTARERLLERIENAEVLLIHDLGHEPSMPIVQPGKGRKSDTWILDDSLNLQAQLNLQMMLDRAHQTRGIWAPIFEPKKEAPKPEPTKEEKQELSVTNPRWEHVDEKRKESSPDATIAGDIVTLMVDVTGVSDGTRISFKVFDTSISPPSRIAAVRGEVEGGIGKGEWTVKINREGPKLEFEGEVRRLSSDRAEIDVGVVKYILSF